MQALSTNDLQAELVSRGANSELSYHPMQSLFREIICRTHKALIVVEMPKRAGFDSSCATTFSSTVDALGLMEWCKNEINARAEFATQYRLALGKGEPEGGWEEGVDGPDEGGGDSDCTPA